MRHEVWRDGGGFLVVGSVGRVHHRRPVYLVHGNSNSQRRDHQGDEPEIHSTSAVPPRCDDIEVLGVPQPCAPAFQMGTFDTNRSLLKYILLGIITFGIYDVWVLARAGEDLNV
jgi:hypothetical protein